MVTATRQLHRAEYGAEWIERMWQESWAYIKTVVDTAYNPFLILDEHLRVVAANKLFYKLVHIDEKDAEPKYINELGNGVWNVHVLGALLAGILPRNTFFKGIEISSEFPSLGKRIMLLNGRMHLPIILLTMEDNAQMTVITAELADYAARTKTKMNERTEKLETQVGQLKKDVREAKRLVLDG